MGSPDFQENQFNYSQCGALVICCYSKRSNTINANNSKKRSSRRVNAQRGIIWISVYCPSSNSEWDGSFFWYLTFGMLALNFSHASNSLTNHRKCGNYLCWMKSHLKHPRCESRRDTCLEEKRVYRWNVKGCEWDEREQWGEYDHSVCMCNCQIIKETF